MSVDQVKELNLKGLAINLCIACAVAALHSIRLVPGGGYSFDAGNFLADSGLVFAFGNVVGFFTHAHVPVGGQGLPGQAMNPGPPNP